MRTGAGKRELKVEGGGSPLPHHPFLPLHTKSGDGMNKVTDRPGTTRPVKGGVDVLVLVVVVNLVRITSEKAELVNTCPQSKGLGFAVEGGVGLVHHH